jgi:aspartate/methionine/tyrosine aminotransferase
MAFGIQEVEGSPTIEAHVRAKKLAREWGGEGPYSKLTAGEPDGGLPEDLKKHFPSFLDVPDGYTVTEGIPEARTAVVEAMQRRWDYPKILGPDGEPLTAGLFNGAKNGADIFFKMVCAKRAFTDNKRAVAVFAPYWPTYIFQIIAAGGKPVIIDCSRNPGLKPTEDQLLAFLDQYPDGIINLNPFNNPTGSVLEEDELVRLGEVILRNNGFSDVLVLSDDIYCDVILEGQRPKPLAALLPELGHRVVSLRSAAKGEGGPGHRLAWVVGAPQIMNQMAARQSQHNGNMPNLNQEAIGIMMQPQFDDFLREHYRVKAAQYKERLDTLTPSMASIGITREQARGTFYGWFDASEVVEKKLVTRDGQTINTVEDLDRFWQTHGVSVTPGTGFGDPKRFRASCSAADEEVTLGAQRTFNATRNHLYLPETEMTFGQFLDSKNLGLDLDRARA